jgi:hypothetical protein
MPQKKSVGAECTTNEECSSGICPFGQGAEFGVCSQQCSTIADYPGAFIDWSDRGHVTNATGRAISR